MKKRILIPTDFTDAAARAVRQAEALAGINRSLMVLLHVTDDPNAAAKAEASMKAEAERIRQETGLVCETMIRPGSIFSAIPQETCGSDYDLVVIGTHGVKGIRQKMMGPDILKLASRIRIPVLVVQKDSAVVAPFRRIVLPVSSHESFEPAVDAVTRLAGSDTEIIFYSIHKAGFEWPEKLIRNIEKASEIFESRGIRMTRVREEQTVYSPGYAKQTLKSLDRLDADLICMISVPSEEYYYFAEADKEQMIMNEKHLPVLFAGGGC
jgi:nucleotide-binding universal stress UspA family protein